MFRIAAKFSSQLSNAVSFKDARELLLWNADSLYLG
jgi:hypothetical protein